MIIKNPPVYDISHWKEVADFNAISPRPLLMITKATESIYIQDSKFIRFFAGMKQAGFHRGCYHFFRKAYGAVPQAQYFVDFIAPHIDENTILILDMEEGGESTAQVLAWFDYVRAARPRNRVMLYSRRDLLNALVMTSAQKDAFREIPTWVAGYLNDPDDYDTVPSFYIPDPTRFGAVALWQYSAHGAVTGIDGDVDLNWISPTYQQILGAAPQPQQGVINMARYEMTSVYSMSCRAEHSTQSGVVILTTIPAQSKMHGDELWTAPGEKWLKVYDVGGLPIKNAAGLTIPFGWVAMESAYRIYCSLNEINPPVVTEPIAYPSRVELVYADGVRKVYLPE